MTDIITSICEIFVEKGRVPRETSKIIEHDIRLQYGGELTYIAKRCALIDSKIQLINSGLRAGYSIIQIEQSHGIPRRTIYRLINRSK